MSRAERVVKKGYFCKDPLLETGPTGRSPPWQITSLVSLRSTVWVLQLLIQQHPVTNWVLVNLYIEATISRFLLGKSPLIQKIECFCPIKCEQVWPCQFATPVYICPFVPSASRFHRHRTVQRQLKYNSCFRNKQIEDAHSLVPWYPSQNQKGRGEYQGTKE